MEDLKGVSLGKVTHPSLNHYDQHPLQNKTATHTFTYCMYTQRQVHPKTQTTNTYTEAALWGITGEQPPKAFSNNNLFQ